MPGLAVSGDIPADPPSTSPEFPSPFAAASSSAPAAAHPRRSFAVPAAIAGLVAVLAVLAVLMTRGPDDTPTPAAPTPVAAPPPIKKDEAPLIKPDPAPPPVVTPEPTPPADPIVTPDPTPPATQPVARPNQPRRPPTPPAAVDPLKAAAKLAKACRRTHKAETGPKITIDYAVGSNGKVTRAVPVQKSELGNCLADAVRRTEFPPKLILGQQIAL
jgi:hypothetical protein